jgi:hypothetical protein
LRDGLRWGDLPLRRKIAGKITDFQGKQCPLRAITLFFDPREHRTNPFDFATPKSKMSSLSWNILDLPQPRDAAVSRGNQVNRKPDTQLVK